MMQTTTQNCSTFTMHRSYERPVTLQTNDLLTAVKQSISYEADLYVDNRLLVSWSGLNPEVNHERLLEVGIQPYLVNGSWKFKYIDETKNVKTYFVHAFIYPFQGVLKAQINVQDYSEDPTYKSYSSLDEALLVTSSEFSVSIPSENINVVIWDDEGCRSFTLKEYQDQKDTSV